MALLRTWARIELENNRWIVRETINFDPLGNFHPSLVWVECPLVVGQGWTYDEKKGRFTSPDGIITHTVPLTQGAYIDMLLDQNQALKTQNDALQIAVAELSILLAGGGV